MQLTLEGLDNHGIARQLGISHRTVETHKARVLQKIGVSSVAELIRMSDARIKADAQLLSDLYVFVKRHGA
ncbi:MAG: helix-turn-helix transcriptional regulator [Azonexus sp.]|nr:helix-turn-helix transcriptional regulator [Azonexus sp.]